MDRDGQKVCTVVARRGLGFVKKRVVVEIERVDVWSGK